MFYNKPYEKNSGFTLIELLVVIAIIGVMSSVALASLNSAREKALIAKALQEIRSVDTAVYMYYAATGVLPTDCDWACTESTDPFRNSLGVYGWHGPYITLWNRAHPWKGHMSVITSRDATGDGVADCAIVLNDDRPGTSGADNGGQIPQNAMLEIDRRLDDGNLETGRVTGDVSGSTMGELLYFCSQF